MILYKGGYVHMKINYIGTNIEVTEALRNIIEQKFKSLKRHFDNEVTTINVTFTSQKLNHTVKADLHVKGKEIFAEGQNNESMYKAIDAMMIKLKKQIQKYKEKKEEN
jgi:putative sigma-54 modulation protein